MGNLIIIRLHPDKPIKGDVFTSYLDGLTITAYDLSCGDPKVGKIVGSATYLPPPTPPLPLDPTPWIPDPNTGIVQHYTPPKLFPLTQPQPEAAATAVIEVNLLPLGYKEYVSPDLRIEINRGGTTISEKNFFYDVTTNAGPVPPTIKFPDFPADQVSLYLKLPCSVSAGTASLELNNDGSPPNFKALKDVVTSVLSADQQPIPPAVLRNLTIDQARHIAYEIVWGSQDQIPELPTGIDDIGVLYSNPPNDESISNSFEQNRQQFEGNLTAYYATRNAQVDRLARYVFALSTAIACEEFSILAKSVVLQFPLNIGKIGKQTTSVAEVLLINGGGPLIPPFVVPAEYFYILGAQLPIQIGAVQRFGLACSDNQDHLLPILSAAYDAGIISPVPAVNPAQAVRRLTALRPEPVASTPKCQMVTVMTLVMEWIAFPQDIILPPPQNNLWRIYKPGDDIENFWLAESKKPAQSLPYLNLVLCALTDNYQPLIEEILKLPIASTDALATMSEADWKRILLTKQVTGSDAIAGDIKLPFALAINLAHVNVGMEVSGFGIANDTIVTAMSMVAPVSVTLSIPITSDIPKGTAITFNALPPFTLPGTPDTRLNAFLRHVRKFFDMAFDLASIPLKTADAAPMFDIPAIDVIVSFVTAYQGLIGGPFTFGSNPFNDPDPNVDLSVQSVFPGNTSAQSWLNQRVRVLNELCLLAGVTSIPQLPATPSFAFSVAEALYSRGFTSKEDIQALSFSEFEDALRGTVAFPEANPIYVKAWAPAAVPGPMSPPSSGTFQPINPGSLVNCIPPCYLSPLGPVEYLHELLNLSEESTCTNPFAPALKGRQTLGDVIASRRGPLGNLAVTAANAETQIPLIDIVNENLENLAAILPATPVGVIYDTATDNVSGHKLCVKESKDSDHCHKPCRLLETLPEHSSPAVPVGQPTAYDRLKLDFSSPQLPYSQPLDICRTYLDHFGTCRFETMRTFRKEITEFTLDPTLAAPVFQSHLWRYPVRIDIAIEYLQLNPEEYDLLFTKDIVDVPTPGRLTLYMLYGFDVSAPGGIDWLSIVVMLPEFLKRTGLTYCELVDLQKSECFQFVVIKNEDPHVIAEFGEREILLPDCEPCCIEHYMIRFINIADQQEALRKLAVFLRLWRKLQHVCGGRYTFQQLCDICEVLQLFIGKAINSDFIRQLVSFQILKDQLQLKLTDGSSIPGTHGAERTHILALWVGAGATKWDWAIDHLLDCVQHFARKKHERRERTAHFVKLLGANLDPLSILAGFNPSLPDDTWHARPANTLRFAEILAKIYASNFGIGEILYLFTADDHLDGDDPFSLQSLNETLDNPLELPDDDPDHSLWTLRKKLLSVEVTEEDLHEWNWHRIETAIRHEFGYDVPPGSPDYLTSLGQHFFPTIIEHSGIPVSAKERQYRVNLAAPSQDMWNIPPDGPFRFDPVVNQLWTQLPLPDEAVVEKLEHLRKLLPSEQLAVQNLYHMPRLDLAPFACFFKDFASAERYLIEEREEYERWEWFRRHFVLAYKRCHIIAAHLVKHVAASTECTWDHAHATAWLVLKRLFADDLRTKTSWEDDSGNITALTWKPLPSGGAFAALLGLTGTGLMGEFTSSNGSQSWREVRGPMSAFGHERNEHNAPIPTILPTVDLTLTPDQLKFVDLRNGFAIADKNGRELHGAESFFIRWSGVLLVEEEGKYEFTAGAPTPEGEFPDLERVEHCKWRVTLNRGQKTWIVLSHQWPEEHCLIESCLSMKCGAYGIVVEFVQPPPDFSGVDDIYPQHTGFQVKYTGPDTGSRIETLPLRRLYRDHKDDTLDTRIMFPESSIAALFLKFHYTSSLRDIRRTYQRAFKALLFAHRFELSGHPLMPYQQSELGYMLDHGDLFAGTSYYRNPIPFLPHKVNFDFNFIPLKDPYHSLLSNQDQRVQPSYKREQALFDWWDRIFDYARMRKERQKAVERPVWLLFEEALEKQPDNPAQLLRHLDVDLRHASLVMSYYQNIALPVFHVSFTDLEDDRWAVRAWHGDRWTRQLLYHFKAHDIRTARPDLWASDDPLALVNLENETGNANLSSFLCDGCFEDGEPRRYTDVKKLNDCLREHARSALLAYLCGMNRVQLPWGGYAKYPKELSALLLLDVETGRCERASRIEEAATAIQNFIRRRRLGLDRDASGKPLWIITAEFIQLWKHEFEAFRIWEKCKCRSIYKENWIDWDELRNARKVEAFQLLEEELRRSTLTIAVPGGLEYWPESLPPVHPAVKLLQKRDPSSLRVLSSQKEGLGLLGTQERDARPSWLASPMQDNNSLPFWIQAAIQLGVKFFRIAAEGILPAKKEFRPSNFHEEPGCCSECGCVHPPYIDEYYFWLIGSQVYNSQDQDEYYDPALQSSTNWHNENSLPTLLDWKSASAARLAWCQIHNGEFKQPRRSVDVVQLQSGIVPDLTYVGRVGDSLTFSVSGGITPLGYNGKDAPGFRYDLVTDSSVSLPLVADPQVFNNPFPAGLPVYPFFVFVEPGDRLFPKSLFSPAVSVASLLRCHCRFESALKWYQLVLNPLEVNNSWPHCLEANTQTVVSGEMARNRSILFHYLETLVEWSNALKRQNSRESAQQTRVVLDTAAMILGPCPKVVVNQELPNKQTVATFVPLSPPLNPRLMELYCRVRDGLALVHHCLNSARLHDSTKECRPPYWGQDTCTCGTLDHHCGCESPNEPYCDESEWCRPHSPYRFVFLVQRAQEAVAKVHELATAQLSAFDRGDSEYIASMRARHETQLADMTIKVRQEQWREADWQVKALGKTKEVSQTNRRYYKALVDAGLNNGELSYQSNTESSIDLRSSAIPIEATGEAMHIIPNLFVGTMGVNMQLPPGTKLADMFQAIARISNEFAEIAGITASLDLTQASWQRRLNDWVHQVEVLDIEIEQIEIQILAAERRRNQSLEDLNIQQRQLEQSREMLDALRDKFTSHELFLYLQKETAALFWKMYELARHLASEAQRAFNFEMGYTKRNFLPGENCDNLHEGLMFGERLQLALQRMETEYVDCNRREYELTKHISLAVHFPLEFLRLKITGSCEIDIPEWMFDMDYPGQYMRRIKNISLTIPCVTGPYTGVHCRLTLLRSQTRINPCLPCPVTACCHEKPLNPCGCHHEPHEHYELCGSDQRDVKHYGAREAIATSSGRNDSGLFELNFHDERHLPFEFYGAVSCWRIEIPQENNYFDMDSMTDVLLHTCLTAKEGGDSLRDAARSSARKKLPGNGWIYLDLRKDFPDSWELFRRAHQHRESERSMTVRVTRRLFPFLPADPTLRITKLAILLEAREECEHSCPEIRGCACAHEDFRDSRLVEVTVDHADDDYDDTQEVEISCVRSADWPKLYYGIGDVKVSPINCCQDSHSLTLTFHDNCHELRRAFLLCRYEIVEECCDTMHKR